MCARCKTYTKMLRLQATFWGGPIMEPLYGQPHAEPQAHF